MSENVNQPADDESSLDEQLDSLLARIEAEAPEAVSDAGEALEPPNTAEPEAGSLDAMIDQQVDDAIAAAESVMEQHDTPAEAEPEPDLDEAQPVASEDPLADEVQAMLNEAAASQSDVADALAEEDAAELEEIDAELSGSFTAPEEIADLNVASVSSATASEPENTEPQEDTDLTELDRLLADEADDAIAGDFESPQDVSSASEPAAESAGNEVVALTPDEADEALAGTFESPADLASPAGTAQQVARELDEQPEQQPVPVAAKTSMQPAPLDEADEEAPSRFKAWLPRLERAALHTCALINAPLNRLDAEMRNAIGYVGLATTAIALALILASIVF